MKIVIVVMTAFVMCPASAESENVVNFGAPGGFSANYRIEC